MGLAGVVMGGLVEPYFNTLHAKGSGELHPFAFHRPSSSSALIAAHLSRSFPVCMVQNKVAEKCNVLYGRNGHGSPGSCL